MKPTEEEVKLELYYQLRQCGWRITAERRIPNCIHKGRYDIGLHIGDNLVGLIEVKDTGAHTPWPPLLTRQRSAYNKSGLPYYYCRSLEEIEKTLQWANALLAQNIINIFIDGSCDHEGNGGWAYKFISRDPIGGMVKNTTSNRMELMAVIQGVKSIVEPSYIIVHTDSQYVVGQASKAWKRNRNLDLLAQLDTAINYHKNVIFRWVPRNTCPEQAICDRAARAWSHILRTPLT